MVCQPDLRLADRVATDRVERQRGQRHRRRFRRSAGPGGVLVLIESNIAGWFHTSASVQQTKGTLGDELRNQVFGPPQRQVDFSAFKLFHIREAMRLQFRTEVSNLTNTAILPSPAQRLGGQLRDRPATAPGSTPRDSVRAEALF